MLLTKPTRGDDSDEEEQEELEEEQEQLEQIVDDLFPHEKDDKSKQISDVEEQVQDAAINAESLKCKELMKNNINSKFASDIFILNKVYNLKLKQQQ